MLLVGNDVVDLYDPESRAAARHARFDARVFCADERAWLRSDPHPERLRWTLWAAKESAWKLSRKLDPSLIFSPSAFAVRPDDAHAHALRVSHPSAGDVRVHVVRRAGCLHAVAQLATCRARLLGIAPAERDADGDRAQDASAEVRRFATQALAPVLRCDARRLRVEKRARIPRLCLDSAELDVDLSLSHHGRFVAFAAALARPHGHARVLYGATFLEASGASSC